MKPQICKLNAVSQANVNIRRYGNSERLQAKLKVKLPCELIGLRYSTISWPLRPLVS